MFSSYTYGGEYRPDWRPYLRHEREQRKQTRVFEAFDLIYLKLKSKKILLRRVKKSLQAFIALAVTHVLSMSFIM